MNSSSHDKTPRSSLKMLPSEDGSPALSEGNLRPFSRTSSQPGCEAGNNSLRCIRRTHPSEVGSRAISGGILGCNARKPNRVGCKASTLSKVLMKASVALMILGSFSSPVLAASDPDQYQNLMPKCLDKLGLDDMEGFCRQLCEQLEIYKTDKDETAQSHINLLGVKCRDGNYQLASTGSEGEMLVFRGISDLLLYPFTLKHSKMNAIEVKQKFNLDETKHYLVQVSRYGEKNARLRPSDITTSLKSHTIGDQIPFPKDSYIVWDNVDEVFRLKVPESEPESGNWLLNVFDRIVPKDEHSTKIKNYEEVTDRCWNLKIEQKDSKLKGFDPLKHQPWLVRNETPYPTIEEQRHVARENERLAGLQ